MKTSNSCSPKKSIQMLVLSCVLACCGNPVGLFAQAATSTQHDRIMSLIRRAEFKQAELGIDALLKANIDDHEAHMLRKALGNALISRNRRNSGEAQYEKFLEYLVSGREQSKTLLQHLPQILINLRSLRDQQNPNARQLLDRAYQVAAAAVANDPNNEGYSAALSSAVNYKTQLLAKQGKYDEVKAVYSIELERMRDKWRQQPDDPDSWLSLYFSLGMAAAPRHTSYQSFADKLMLERRNLLNLAVKKFPESSKIVSQYSRDKLEEIEQLRQQSPQGAMTLLSKLQEQINTIYAKNPRDMTANKISVDKAHQKLLRAINRDSLVGLLVPSIEPVTWLNGTADTLNTSSDAVTAILFLASDEDPNNLQLGQLNNFSKQHADKFKLVIVANDYQQSFLRLATVKRSYRNDSDEYRARFRDNLRDVLIENVKLDCPICVSTDAGSAGNKFGIDALPFLVVVDQK